MNRRGFFRGLLCSAGLAVARVYAPAALVVAKAPEVSRHALTDVLREHYLQHIKYLSSSSVLPTLLKHEDEHDDRLHLYPKLQLRAMP